jgi:hypothetical protein
MNRSGNRSNVRAGKERNNVGVIVT